MILFRTSYKDKMSVTDHGILRFLYSINPTEDSNFCLDTLKSNNDRLVNLIHKQELEKRDEIIRSLMREIEVYEKCNEPNDKSCEVCESGCVVCKDNEINSVFPCGHLCVCFRCGINLNKCPICRQNGRVFRVFKP